MDLLELIYSRQRQFNHFLCLIPIFWGLLTISCYSTTKTPVGFSGARSPLAKCCTGNAADAIPCSQSFWFVGSTCVSPHLWIQQRAVISHAAAFSQTGLSSSCLADHLVVTELMERGPEPCTAVAGGMYKVVSSIGRCIFYFSRMLESCAMKQVIILPFQAGR